MDGYTDAFMLAAFGAAAVCASDIPHALRRALRPPFVIEILLDLLSAAAFTAVVWLALLAFARGELRLCTFLCTACGTVLYIFTVRKVVFGLFCVIFKNIFAFFRFILKILLTPAVFLYKIIDVKRRAKSKRNGDDTNVQKDR